MPIPCTLYTVSAGAADEYGDAAPTADGGTATTCYIEQTGGPRGNIEIAEGDGNVESTRWLIHLPPSVSPHGSDYVAITSGPYAGSYTFNEDPWPVLIGRSGLVSHYEGDARRIV